MEESKEKVTMSEEKGKISVIVPVYQAEKYLAKALDSVISQDYENWELFLLVRKSSDQSEKIARDYEKKYNSIHMIERGENKAGEARNQGLERHRENMCCFWIRMIIFRMHPSCSVMSVWQSRQMQIL